MKFIKKSDRNVAAYYFTASKITLSCRMDYKMLLLSEILVYSLWYRCWILLWDIEFEGPQIGRKLTM